MKSSLLLFILFFVTIAFADTTYVSGVQSGTWSPEEGDPYIVTNAITIPEGLSLTIEAGTRVEFINAAGFVAYGSIHCNGTAENHVVFTQDTVQYPVRWRGFRLTSETDTSHFKYTEIYNSAGYYGAIRVGESFAIISHCKLAGMEMFGIEINGGAAEVTDTEIRDRIPQGSGGWGAGITVHPGTLLATGCRFINLHALDGGAVDVSGGQAEFVDCLFESDSAVIWGGVAHIYDSEVSFYHCKFYDNTGRVGSVARVHGQSSSLFSHCEFVGNASITSTYGTLEFENAGPHIVDHCLFLNNITGNVWPNHNIIFAGANTTVTHSIFFGNEGAPVLSGYAFNEISNCSFGSPSDIADDFHDDLPEGFGVLTNTNFNGDSIDTFGNLFSAPMFDPSGPNGAYGLSYFSHMINAGDPNGQPDADGTIPDIGPHPFYHLDQITDLTIELVNGTNHLRLRWSDVPEASNYWVFRTTSGLFDWETSTYLGSNPDPVFIHLDALLTPVAQGTYIVVASQSQD